MATDSAVPQHLDVLIVGAGLSGIGAAHHLQEAFPAKTYAIFEARDAIGGTWDLFRYPGVRSDSDMHTLGYRFKPWTDPKAIADGSLILDYVREAAREGGIERHIRFHHRIVGAAWSSADARWTVTAQRTDTGENVQVTAGFLYVAGGYYRYDEGFTPAFPGIESFAGQVVHPQHWPQDLDYEGKRVVVIGSGATAITLVPAMTEKAAHVTMLQRSPTYVVSQPAVDPFARALGKRLPDRVAYPIARWKNVALSTFFFQLTRRRPDLAKKLIRKGQEMALPDGYDIDTHFTPRYNPWDQRLCVAPDGDLFRAIRHGRATIVTDTIRTFTEKGVELDSGETLEADIVVTATGLNLQAFGGVAISVDGTDVSLPETMAYKGLMLSGVPNFAFTVGYTNASWTLKADLVSEYVCRLLAHMDRNGYRIAVPTDDDPTIERRPLMDFAAGYVLRSVGDFPKQGSRAPWQLGKTYAQDLIMFRRGKVDDGVMRFSSPASVPAVDPALTLA